MRQYQELLADVMETGTFKGDRTGTGTKSVFGRQIRMDLSEGFPLLTTKKMFTKAIIHELLWIISGDTNIQYLKDNGVSIWDEWRKPYSLNREVVTIDRREPEVTIPFEGYLGQYVQDKCPLRKIWLGMMGRCYSPKNDKYNFYGGQGVTVSPSWHNFDNFKKDVKQIPNWYYKENDWNNYFLDKDYYGSNQYGKNTCVWLSCSENNQYTKNSCPVYVNGNLFISSAVAAKCNGITTSSLHRFINEGIPNTLKGNNKKYRGWGFEKYEGQQLVRLKLIEEGCMGPIYGKQWRSWGKEAHDQIHNVINTIKTNPDCRRMLVSSWNVDDIDDMALPPCHCLFQFYVADGKLSCQLYQRSADIFLGVPFNIASYAALTHMIAQVCDLEVGEFVHTFGDLHLYSNHIEQAELQLLRRPKPLPQLLLNPEVTNIDDFQYEDFVITNYVSHPTIKAEVSV